MRRILVLMIIAVLVVGGGIFFTQQRGAIAQQSGGGNGGGPPGSEAATEIIDATTVRRGSLTVTVSATGDVSPDRQADLNFETSALVTEVLIDEGQRVESGDVLARLDTTDLRDQYQSALVNRNLEEIEYRVLVDPPRDVDVAVVEAQLVAARAAAAAALDGPDATDIEIARLRIEAARNQLWQDQLRRDDVMQLNPEFRGGDNGARAEEIQVNSGIERSETNISVREAEYAVTVNEGPDEAGLAGANADRVSAEVRMERLLEGGTDIEIAQAQIDLERAQLDLERAQARLDETELRAPFSGILAENNLVMGELPPSEGAAVLLLDDSAYFVNLEVDESDVIDVQLGQPVEMTFDALPGEVIEGTIERINLTPTGNDQIVTYHVRVVLETGTELVRSGMSATGTIIIDQLDDVLTVPTRFIRIDRATQQAFATVEVDPGVFEEVPVELGLRNDANIEILSGLQEGDRLVLLPRETFNPLEN